MTRKLALTVAETAERLGCSPWSVYRAVRNGDLPTVPFVGRRVLIPAAHLERIVAARATFRNGGNPMTTADSSTDAVGEACR